MTNIVRRYLPNIQVCFDDTTMTSTPVQYEFEPYEGTVPLTGCTTEIIESLSFNESFIGNISEDIGCVMKS